MLPGYTYVEGRDEHGLIAKNLLFSVLKEYALDGSYSMEEMDLDHIEMAYKKGFFGLIINETGKKVGTFGLIRKSERTAEIRKMYLLPEARGKGLGKWMVSFLIEKAKSLGYKEIELETASKFTQAIGLYQKMGFIQRNIRNLSPSCDRSFFMKL